MIGRRASQAWRLDAATARADWSGDGRADVLAVDANERLLMYRGNGAGGWVPGSGEAIGTGWGAFTAVLSPGDFNGDGKPDLLVRRVRRRAAAVPRQRRRRLRHRDGRADRLRLAAVHRAARARRLQRRRQARRARPPVRRHAAAVPRRRRRRLGHRHRARRSAPAGQRSPRSSPAATSAATASPTCSPASPTARCCCTAATAPAAGSPAHGGADRLRLAGRSRRSPAAATSAATASPTCSPASPTARCCCTAATAPAAGVTGTGEPIGSGWGSLGSLTLAAQWRPPPAPTTAAARAAERAAARRPGEAVGGDPLHPARRPAAREPARPAAGPGGRRRACRRVVFFARGGPRRIDRRRPYVVRLRVNRPAGARGRVYARVVYRREGSRQLRHKTVSRRFVMCR